MVINTEHSIQIPVLSCLEIKQVDSSVERLLLELFNLLIVHGDDIYFHPHKFDQESAHHIVTYRGKDLYYLMTVDDFAIGYGLLRGWDEGYTIPSLGIAIHPAYRSQGLSRVFMSFLHAAARLRGANQVRLKVYPQNITALNLYRQLGYVFSSVIEDDQLVGYINLSK
jgi:[ribosomal protein S18]-alanine N-acetyltransferase